MKIFCREMLQKFTSLILFRLQLLLYHLPFILHCRTSFTPSLTPLFSSPTLHALFLPCVSSTTTMPSLLQLLSILLPHDHFSSRFLLLFPLPLFRSTLCLLILFLPHNTLRTLLLHTNPVRKRTVPFTNYNFF